MTKFYAGQQGHEEAEIIHVRIRKPRGMKILHQLVENLPKELIKESV